MPFTAKIAVLGYLAVFCSIPDLRSQFLYNDEHILFWILALVYLVMVPVSIKAVMSLLKNTRAALSFCLVSNCKNIMNNFSGYFCKDRWLKNVVFSQLTPLIAAQNPDGFCSGYFCK